MPYSAAWMIVSGFNAHWCTQRPSAHSNKPFGAPRICIQLPAIGARAEFGSLARSALAAASSGDTCRGGASDASTHWPRPVVSRASNAAAMPIVAW